MPPSEEMLIRRIVSNPVDHIKCRNLAALQGYLLGYRMACETWSIPCVLSDYDVNAVHRWLLDQLEATEEHRGRLNAFNWLSLENWARFLTYDERDAFDAYLELWAAAPRREASDPESSKVEELQSPPRPQRSFLEMLEPLRKRPGMYFGALPNALTVWSFCSGFHWAERDHGLSPSLAEPILTQFRGEHLGTTFSTPCRPAIPWARSSVSRSICVFFRKVGLRTRQTPEWLRCGRTSSP
jgi:hypothetical protein